jgi:trimeric autotransporter adhesin
LYEFPMRRMRSATLCGRLFSYIERRNSMKSTYITIIAGLLAVMAHAAKPATGEPLVGPIVQQAYLKASNTRGLAPGRIFGDQFGSSIAVSGDTVVVGAPHESSNATGVNGNQADTSADGAGAAYVFVRSGTTWTQQAYLKASNTRAGAAFGSAVAVLGDTIVVGARNESSGARGINGDGSDGNAIQSGAAYVFVREGTNWVQQAYLKASNAGAHDQFGNSVAISGDTLLVGAVYEDSGSVGVNGDQNDNSAYGAGAAYVFVRQGTNWIQEAYLKASNAAELDFFGWSVGISGDIIAIGAPWEWSNATGINGDQTDNSADNAGAAYFFKRSGTTWRQEAYVKGSNTEGGDAFGISVGVSGETVVVGAFWEDSNSRGVNGNQLDNSSLDSGAAYVFVRNSGNWSQQAYLKAANNGPGDWFGGAVAISGDALLIGAMLEDSSAGGVNVNDNSAVNSGAAYLFARNGTLWFQNAYLKPSNPGGALPGPDWYGDSFGTSVAISGDTMVIGAFREASSARGVNGNQTDDTAVQAGAAYIFDTIETGVQQICSCDAAWKNHGEYVQCVMEATSLLVARGMLTDAERRQIVQQAAESACGKKNR